MTRLRAHVTTFVLGILLAAALPAQVPLATMIGTGCTDASGRIAVLSTSQLPFIGNTGFDIDITMGTPGNTALVFFATGLSSPPLPLGQGSGCLLYLDPASTIFFIQQFLSPLPPVTLGSMGSANIDLPIPPSPALAGLDFTLQTVILDPALSLGFTVSNALELLLN